MKTFRTKTPTDDESYKTRKGKVGGHADYLSEEDQQSVVEAIQS